MTDSRERLYYRDEGIDQVSNSDDLVGDWVGSRLPVEKEAANLVGSLCGDGYHRPCLDIDFPARLVPSSTPGHYHLYLEVPMTTEKYLDLIDALAIAGVVSPRYAGFCRQRGGSFCRPEGVKKKSRWVQFVQRIRESLEMPWKRTRRLVQGR